MFFCIEKRSKAFLCSDAAPPVGLEPTTAQKPSVALLTPVRIAPGFFRIFFPFLCHRQRSKIFQLTTAPHLALNTLSFNFSKENKRKGTPFGEPTTGQKPSVALLTPLSLLPVSSELTLASSPTGRARVRSS